MELRNRIKDRRIVKGRDLVPHPRNWRTHPNRQKEALAATLRADGITRTLLAFELEDGRLMTIDGHCRAKDYPDADWPVDVLDVTPEEAERILTTLDPIGALAGANTEMLEELLLSYETDDDGMRDFLAELAESHGIDSVVDSLGNNLSGAAAPNLDPGDDRYKEQYGVIIVYNSEGDQQATFNKLSGMGYECRVVVT